MSDNAIIEGNCKYEDTASMRISWEGYNLIMSFAKVGVIYFVSTFYRILWIAAYTVIFQLI